MIRINLEKVAVEKDVNKSQLSLRAQVGLGVVRRYWENDSGTIDLRILDKMCAALECDICDILVRTPYLSE